MSAVRQEPRLAGGLDEIRRGLQNAGEEAFGRWSCSGACGEVHGSSVTLRLTDDKPKRFG